MGAAIGIDLGTTFSAAAKVGPDGTPAILPNRFGKQITPSVLCIQKDQVIVGQEAKELQASGAEGIAAFFKRQMGEPNFVFHAHGRDYSAIDLSALVLKTVKEDAERVLGEAVTHAVITVPAYFKNPEREATIEAGRRAGLEVLQTVNEPTAAAISYGFRGTDREQTLLVYDLGGGTFDVTLMKLGKGEIRILTSGGDHELGGKDWDDRIVQFLASRFEAEFGSDPLDDLESFADLLVRAEDAKKRLSVAESAQISLVHAGDHGRYSLDRATFERITEDLMHRTIDLTRQVLGDQKLSPSRVDGVLLVGGSTRMPMVHHFVEREFGKPPMTGVNVDEAVALGAALVAAERTAAPSAAAPGFFLRGAVKTVDVTNHSLGMIALNESRSWFLNSVILSKNQPIPCRETRPYQHRVRRKGENILEIFMTQGEADTPKDVTYLGKYVLHDIPWVDGGVAVIDIEYAYDESGTVQVTGKLRKTGETLRLTIEPSPQDIPDRFLRAPEEGTETVHLTAYLAFDLSGSMSGEPLAAAKKAAKGFLKNTDRCHCSLGIIGFSDSVVVKIEASQNAKAIEKAIDSLTVGETGGGNAGHPFDRVRDLMRDVPDPRFVITLADGVWSDQEVAIAAARSCKEDGIESIAIGFGGADREFLSAIASSDEASLFTSLGGLTEAFVNIAQILTESPQPSDSSKGPVGMRSGLSGFFRR